MQTPSKQQIHTELSATSDFLLEQLIAAHELAKTTDNEVYLIAIQVKEERERYMDKIMDSEW